jgi:hypothetical protein
MNAIELSLKIAREADGHNPIAAIRAASDEQLIEWCDEAEAVRLMETEPTLRRVAAAMVHAMHWEAFQRMRAKCQ